MEDLADGSLRFDADDPSLATSAWFGWLRLAAWGVAVRHAGRVISRQGFVDHLLGAVPETAALVAEHRADNDGELLLHLLMADIQRFTVMAFQERDIDVVRRLLGFVDLALREGDTDVVNAVLVSFIEDYGAAPGESDGLLELWPASLREQLHR